MGKKIDITVKLPVRILKDMIEQSEHVIVDQAKFNQIIASDEFKKTIAQELINCFQCMNEDDDEVLVEMVPELFGDAVELE